MKKISEKIEQLEVECHVLKLEKEKVEKRLRKLEVEKEVAEEESRDVSDQN